MILLRQRRTSITAGHELGQTFGAPQGIDVVIDRLDGLLDGGRSELVIELTEHAIICAERAVEFVDDSDGLLSGVVERLAELHLAACEAASPDPVQLAARLYQRELAGDQLDAFLRRGLALRRAARRARAGHLPGTRRTGLGGAPGAQRGRL
jgi:hypothetical protein